MKPNRRKLFVLYLVLCSAMAYSGMQLFETGAQAQDEGAGTCCQVSSDCPGAKLCYLPGDKADCCRPALVYQPAMVRTIVSNRHTSTNTMSENNCSSCGASASEDFSPITAPQAYLYSAEDHHE